MRLPIPPIVLALALALVLAAPFAFLAGRRGGRYRALPGWVGFWAFFAALLVCLSRAQPWISFPLLAIPMFMGLRHYAFLAPVRPRDRWGLLVAFLAIPASLYPAWHAESGVFPLAVPLALLLVLPALLASGTREPGLLDSMGRLYFGILTFVLCAAHLGRMTHMPVGSLELFGIQTVLAELPQRLAGRPRPGGELVRPLMGILASAGLAIAAGAWLGPWAGLTTGAAGLAGLAVTLAVAAGGIVAEGIAQDVAQGPAASRTGRAAFLDRVAPALYAAPIYYYLLRALE